MSHSFKAAVLSAPNPARPYARHKPLSLETVSVPAPAEGEVLVKIAAASLCRSDLSVINGVRAWPIPIVPGHEASGTVVETGSGVTSVGAGDPVVLIYQPQCGTCPACLDGEAHLCGPGLAANRKGELLSGGPRLSLDGTPVHHHMGLSAFAEYALVSEKSVVRVPRDLPLDIAALFGCAVMCGAGTVLNTGAIKAGDTVVIAGTGGVGLSALLGARAAGAARIIAVDPDPAKLEHAKRLGASDVIHSGDRSAAAEVLELTSGGVDIAFETAGKLGAFEIAYDSARRGGTVVSVGLVDPKTPFQLDVAALVTGAKTVKGSYVGSCNPRTDIPRFIAMHQRGLLPVGDLITHRMPLSEVNAALDRMEDGTAIRQILTP